MVRAAHTQHAEDDDWGQAGTLVREVLSRAFECWANVDAEIGTKVEENGRTRAAASAPTTWADPTTPGDEAGTV